MKKVLFVFALVYSSAVSAQMWNNPFVGICRGEYRVVTNFGAGSGQQQINHDDDTFVQASVGITPTVGVWQVELRYSNFDDGSVSVDQYGLNFKVDFTFNCDVQCLYWMAGWNYGDFDVDKVKRGGEFVFVDERGDDNYWNAGVGYRYNWTDSMDTSIEYNYYDVGKPVSYDFDLGHLRSLTLNIGYRF
ncbi:outer membrane beta-barrel protein [Microbulbifer thermotolerans]|uniref:outer membrane protein n=1 Tax=Microbulbifer thermotolerans TaxID=252514 RepID=UPI002671C981|nr:outer membrane beta-barrel protein [Microbulbifer thermotolerans]WKT60373.1 outer membrane beta-barrel protein [Microbulbifer thermotolerans]